MKYPKINLNTDYTGDFEAEHLCFLAKGISLGHYQDNGFLVLPKLEAGNSKSVYFPRLAYSANFWRALKFNANKNLCSQFSKDAVAEAKTLLTKIKCDYKKETEKILHDWQKIEDDFFDLTNKFLCFKKELQKVDGIDILITPFGTLGSFNPPRIGAKFNLLATSRVDFPAGNIAAIILQNLYIVKNKWGGEIGENAYVKRMAAIDFIFTSTAFCEFYPNYPDSGKIQFSLPKKLIEKSNRYLNKLGFPPQEIKLDLENGTFTPQETELLKYLLQHKEKLVSFDTTAKILWGKDSYDKYSPQAMAKVIENIRRKIKNQGINKEVIFTQRGKGYFLN